MGRTAACPRCAAPIRWERLDYGELIPLDLHETMAGPHRYAIADDGRLLAVVETAQVLAYSDHRHTCPAA